jgi:hypothetical protein
MSENVARKSNLRRKYCDFKKSEKIPDKSNIFHVICDL